MERRISKLFGTDRTPLSGEMSKHTSSDTLHDDLYIECKKRNDNFLLKDTREDWNKSIENAEEENKIPIMILSKKYENTDDARVVLKLKDFLELIKNEYKKY